MRGSRRRSVGDRVGKAASTAEARGGGIRDRVVAVDRCGAAHEVRHTGNGERIVLGIAVISEHGNGDRSARRRRRRIVNRDGGVIARRLAFEGGGDVDVAHALGVAQSACAGAEAEIGEVRAAEELGSDVAGERSPWLAIEGVAQRLRCRIPGDNDGMPRAVLDIGQGHRRGGEGAVGAEETGVVAGDVGAGHAGGG